jgi:uncharacterized protein (TIRG00374 family)
MQYFSPRAAKRAWPVLLVAVAAYVILVSYADVSETAKHLNRVSSGRIAIAFAMSLASLLVRAARWRYFTGSIGVRSTMWDSLLTFLAGVAMSITPGKVGELVKCLLLKEAWDVPVARSAPLVLAERITDLVAVLLLGGIGVFAIPRGELVGVGTLAVGVLILVLFMSKPAAALSIRAASRLPFVARHRDKVEAMYASLEEVSRPSAAFAALILALVAWSLQGFVIWVLAGAFPGADVSILESLVASSAPLLAGALALIPGGLGATEASMAGILVLTGGPGLGKSVAIVVMLLARVVCFWFAIVLGLAGLVVWRVAHRASPEEKTPA